MGRCRLLWTHKATITRTQTQQHTQRTSCHHWLFVDFLVLTYNDFQISFLSLWHNINVLFLKARICCPYLGKLDLNPRISLDLAGLSKQPVATAFCLCRWKNRNKFTRLMDPITRTCWRKNIYKHFFWFRQRANTCFTFKSVRVIFSFSHVVRWLFSSFCILTSYARKKNKS